MYPKRYKRKPLKTTRNAKRYQRRMCSPDPEYDVDLNTYSVVPIHKRPELMATCATLINCEWPRSTEARMGLLYGSKDKLPTSLVLLKNDEQLLGHIKLTPMAGDPKSCFIENLVIDKKCRGQGLGRLLMQQTEEYCKNFLHLNVLYLATIDQIVFYLKLGYKECEPVSIFAPINYQQTINLTRRYYMKKVLQKSDEDDFF